MKDTTEDIKMPNTEPRETPPFQSLVKEEAAARENVKRSSKSRREPEEKSTMKVKEHSLSKLSDNYSSELKMFVCTKTCTQMSAAALSLVAKRWKQPQCPSIGELINKPWYIHTMRYYSVIKINELESKKKKNKCRS